MQYNNPNLLHPPPIRHQSPPTYHHQSQPTVVHRPIQNHNIHHQQNQYIPGNHLHMKNQSYIPHSHVINSPVPPTQASFH